MTTIIKILLFIWPFIKEMVLGKKTMTEAIKDNKRKVAIAFIIVGSLGLNMFALMRLWTLSAQYLELQHKYIADTTVHPKVPIKQGPVVADSKKPAVEETKPDSKPISDPPKKPRSEKFVHPVAVDTQATERAKKLREHFDKIKKREETDGSV